MWWAGGDLNILNVILITSIWPNTNHLGRWSSPAMTSPSQGEFITELGLHAR